MPDYQSDEEKTVMKIDRMLAALQKSGFSRQEAFSLLGLAIQLSKKDKGN